MVIPNIIKNRPLYVQRAFIKEFDRIFENSGSAVMAFESATQIVRAFEQKADPIIQTLQKSIVFSGEIAELDSDLLPKEILEQVKQSDPHPFFAVYKIGKDGLSVGEKIRKIWSFGAIKELAKKIKDYAADIIDGHTAGSEVKPKLGHVVWSYTKNVGKSLYSYAVAHITDDKTKERIKSGELDLCSVEGEVEFSKQNGKDWFIDKVINITKLALANSKIDKPGFADAGLVTTIQELESKGNDEMPGENKVENISVYEVKVAIEKLNLKPTDLFRNADLLEADSVKKHIESEVEKVKTEKQKEIDAVVKKLEPLEAKERSTKLSGFVDKSPLLTDKPAKLREYIKDKISMLDVKDADDSAITSKVDDFVKKQLDDVTKYGLKFGDDGDEQEDEQDEKNNTNTDGNRSTANKKSTGKVDRKDPIAMADPSVNDNIPD